MTPAILATVGALCFVAAATNLQPSWMPPSIAALIGSLFLCVGLGLDYIGRLLTGIEGRREG